MELYLQKKALFQKLPYLLIAIATTCYSLFSFPAPREYGIAELIIALCLIGFIAINIKSNVRFIFSKERNWEKILFFVAVILAAGLLIIGLINKQPLFDIARDLIPLLYLFLPVMIFSLISKEPLLWRKLVTALLILSAIALTIRYWASPLTNLSLLGKEYLPFTQLSSVFEPCTFFSSTFLITFPIIKDTGFKKQWDIISRIAMFLIGLCILTLPVASIMRGQIILIVVSLAAAIGYKIFTLNKGKRRILFAVTLVSLLILSFVLRSEIVYFSKIILLKFQHVGFNGKIEEALMVVKQVSSNPFSLLFGKGLGATFLNPVTMDSEYTRYTHNVFTFFLLKGGIVGVALFSLYFTWICKQLIKVLKAGNLPMFLAIFNTLVIHFMLEGSYKLMTIGLIISILYTFNVSKEKETHGV